MSFLDMPQNKFKFCPKCFKEVKEQVEYCGIGETPLIRFFHKVGANESDMPCTLTKKEYMERP